MGSDNILNSNDFDVLQQLIGAGADGVIDDNVYHFPSAIKLESLGLSKRDDGKNYSTILPPKKEVDNGNI